MLQGCDVPLCEQHMILWLKNVAVTSSCIMTSVVWKASEGSTWLNMILLGSETVT